MSKMCKHCKWFETNKILPDGFCCRYPEHMRVYSCDLHWCGEFKERDE